MPTCCDGYVDNTGRNLYIAFKEISIEDKGTDIKKTNKNYEPIEWHKRQKNPYKETMRCKYIKKGITCPYGDDCAFAHKDIKEISKELQQKKIETLSKRVKLERELEELKDEHYNTVEKLKLEIKDLKVNLEEKTNKQEKTIKILKNENYKLKLNNNNLYNYIIKKMLLN
mgnify:CR=1 FL=1|tara:strand:- start:2513 stop:3022 length:510 start_codon:yes stop_codon:yes gene_type:complete